MLTNGKLPNILVLVIDPTIRQNLDAITYVRCLVGCEMLQEIRNSQFAQSVFAIVGGTQRCAITEDVADDAVYRAEVANTAHQPRYL